MQPDFIFIITILIFSVVIHEVSHGYAANYLGDPTARLAGRLTLNPIKHLDMMGSIIIPALLIITGAGFIFGWAKPVPYNPYNLRRGGRWAEGIVAGAGVTVNILLAIIFGVIARFWPIADTLKSKIAVAAINPNIPISELTTNLSEIAFGGIVVVIIINLILAFFNLIPIPPLDGSKVLTEILPYNAGQAYRRFQDNLARYGLIALFGFLFLFIFIFGPIFIRFVFFVFSLITGIHFF